MRIVLSNVRKKIREPLNVTKVHSHMMLVLQKVMMVPSNVRKKIGEPECDKSIVTCDVSTTKCENCTIEYEKK